jgi:3-keto-disaccharide hydrolase
MFVRRFSIAFVLGTLLVSSVGRAQEYLTGIKWPEPPIVSPGKTDADPPSDAVVLFDGKDLSAWNNGERWKVEDGVATAGGGDITTKESFGDCQLHIEWSSPVPARGRSQERGNSGVFLAGVFEIQVLDSFDNPTYADGQAAAMYGQFPPLVNASRKPGEWQSYDISFSAPKFNGADLVAPAVVTVFHNGVLVHNARPFWGPTAHRRIDPYIPSTARGPVGLQDHGNPVRYRNVWLREIR